MPNVARRLLSKMFVVLMAALLVTLCVAIRPAHADDALKADSASGIMHAQGTFENAQAVSLGVWNKAGLDPVFFEWYDDLNPDHYESGYYRFYLPSSGQVTVEESWGMTGEIYDADGASVAWVANDGFNDTQMTPICLTGGTYYVNFTTVWDITSMSFRVSYSSAFESFDEAQGGSNNSLSVASRIALGTTYRGQIAENDAVDCFRFDLPSAGRVSFSLASWLQVSAFVLYDAGGNVLGSRQMSLEDGNSYSSFSGWDDLTKGTYYLSVDGTGEYSSDYTGNFSVNVGFESAGESFAEAQGGSDNGPGWAHTIALGTTYRGQLAANDSIDYYSFKTKESGVVRVTVNSGMSVTDYCFYDAYGDKLDAETGQWNSNTGQQTFSTTIDLGKGEFLFSVGVATESSSDDGYSDSPVSYDETTGPYNFTVVELPSIKKAKVGKIKAQVYTGKKLKPTFKVKLAGKTLRRNVDYTVKFSKNKNVGKAKVTITGKGNYTGTKKVTFKIKKAKQKVKVKGEKFWVNALYTMGYGESVSSDKSYSCTIKKAKGKVTFKKLGASDYGDKFIVKRNGTIVVLPGTPEGTYRLQVKARAKGNRNYKPGSTTFTTTVVVEYW